jgi:hypothetical protein
MACAGSVFGDFGMGGIRPLLPLVLFFAKDFAGAHLLLDRAILQLDQRTGDDVAVPQGVGRGAGVGSDHDISAVMLDPHQRRLTNLAGLRTLEGQDDDRFAI